MFLSIIAIAGLDAQYRNSILSYRTVQYRTVPYRMCDMGAGNPATTFGGHRMLP